MPAPLEPELHVHLTQFSENRNFARQLCAGLTAEQFNWRPSPQRWSIAECLVHLNISAQLFGDRIEDAIRRARRAGRLGTGPFRYGALSRFMLRAVSPEGKQRYRAPRKFVPPPSVVHAPDEVLERFHRAGERWEACLREASGLDLRRVKVASPAISILRIPLGALFAVQAAHERRHLQQAQDVTRAQAFPQPRV